MASPFRVFRKNQKLMLAFLGVLVMVGFVILPILMQGMGVRKQTNPRVATTARYGDLQEANLRSLRWRRQVAIRFFQALGRAVIMAEGNPMALSLVLRDMAPSEDVGPTSDEALVETWLLARRAEELGFLVDERAVVTFLDGLAQERVSAQTWAGILQSVGLSDQDLVGVLRDELLALNLKRAFRFSLQGDTPAQRWDYFQRLNRKVTIESLPVPVSDFVDQVADPDKATLEEFFDRYKDKPHDPTSPDPGFREPTRIKVEYLKAEYESFFEQEKKAVAADEVSAYYKANRENYKKEKLPEFFDEEPAEGESEPAARKDDASEPEAPKNKPEAPTAEDNAAAADAPTESTSPEPAKPEPAKPEPAAPGAADKPASSEKEPAATEPSDDGSAPDAADSNEDTSALEITSPFHLASFAAEDRDEPKASEPEQPAGASEKSTVEAAPAEKTAPEPAPKERPPAEASPPEKSAVEPPAEPPAADSTSPEKPTAEASPAKEPPTEPMSPAGPAIEAKAPEQPAVEKTPAEGPALAAEKPTGEKAEPTAKAEPKAPEGAAAATAKPQYLPLEKVEDEIRGNIARERANDKIEKVLNDLRNELSHYHDKLIRYEVDVQTKKEGEAPAPPERLDFAELAKEHGLKAGPKEDNWEGAPDEWITALNAEKLDIGKSTVGGQISFLESAFDLPNHRPQVSQDANGDRYLFWKLDQVEERVPELDEEGVREEVLEAWKMIEARSLATKAAERMAAEARAANQPLGEAFAERPGIAVTESEPFSWLDYGAIPAWMAQGPPSLGDVRGVEAPGNDFMRAVFDLKKGEIGTAVNQPQRAVYVVRVTDSNPLPDTLWHTFVNETYWNYFRAADHDRSVAEQAWLDGIRSESGFRWDPEYQRQAAQRQAD